MNVAKILTAGTMALALVGCTAPNQTGTNNDTNKKTDTPTEVKKTLSGKLTARSGALHPKAIFVTTEGETQAEASLAFMNISGTDADRYPGAKVVAVAADGTFSVEMKLGTKAMTYGALMVWDDRNNDDKFGASEVAHSGLIGAQAMAQFVLTKTSFKEFVNGAEADVKATYDFGFSEVKQSINFLTEGTPTHPRVIVRTVEGATDAAVAGGFAAAPLTYAVLDNGGYTHEVKLDQKPIKGVMIGMFDDINNNGVYDADTDREATVKDAGEQTTVGVRLSLTDADALKVYTDANGTTAALAPAYTFVFTVPK